MMLIADTADADVLSFFFLLGAVLFVGFGLLALPVAKDAHDDYSKGFRAMARYTWPVGLAIAMITGLVWLYSETT